MTRAVTEIFKGHFLISLKNNPLALIILLSFLFAVVLFFVDVIFNKYYLIRFYIKLSKFINLHRTIFILISALYVVIITIVKNLY